MTAEQKPSAALAASYEQGLLADVMQIHARGFFADPEAIPMLAEMALGTDGDPDDCASSVERLLQEALAGLHRFDRFSREQLRKGIAELLGIGDREWNTQADRFTNAAVELSYDSGESLRKSRRKQADKTYKHVWKQCFELLVAQLVVFANQRGFTYTGRFATVATSKPRSTPVERTLTDTEAIAAQVLAGRVFDELRSACESGIKQAVVAQKVPRCTILALLLFPDGGTILEKTEALFTSVISDLADNDQDRYAGMVELFDLGSLRGLTFSQRRARGHQYLKRDDNNTKLKTYRFGEEEERIFKAMARKLAEKAVRHGLAD